MSENSDLEIQRLLQEKQQEVDRIKQEYEEFFNNFL